MRNTFIIAVLVLSALPCKAQIIIDHSKTKVTTLTESDIKLAKSTLHIAYGHTSHGSQITDGMEGLVVFANNGGKGLKLPANIFAFDDGGNNGRLDLHDYAMSGDVGYYPDWVENTRNYLKKSSNSDVNVIMWSWCGQVGSKYANGVLFSEYLGPMSQFEKEFPKVKFVYMTGHLDHQDDATNKAANDSIRRYCIREKKILFDFADVESYNPDGKFFEFANDDCSYYSSAKSTVAQGNWASEWRAAHTENVDWYNCSSAHSDPLNANQKAYAAWNLFVEIARLIKTGLPEPTAFNSTNQEIKIWPNPSNGHFTIELNQHEGPSEISLISSLGEKIFSTISDGILPVNINLTPERKGIYLIQVRNKDLVSSKIILLK